MSTLGAPDDGTATSGVQTTGWSGLHDGVHASTYETLEDRTPVGRLLMGQMAQKRGLYGIAAACGAGVPATRAVIDADEGSMNVPGSVVDGVTQRDVAISHDQGGGRGNSNGGVVASNDQFPALMSTIRNHGYVADLSLNGGPALVEDIVATP